MSNRDTYLYGNKYGSIPIGQVGNLEEEHDTVKMVLQMLFICCTHFFGKVNHRTSKIWSMSCWQVTTCWDAT